MKPYIAILTMLLLSFTANAQTGAEASQLLKANAAMLEKDYQQAASLYTQALKARDLPQRYWLKAGIAHYETGNYQQALDDLSQLRGQLRSEQYYWEAKCYAQLGDTEKAMEKIERHTENSRPYPQNKVAMDDAFIALAATDAWQDFWADAPYNEYDALYADALTQFRDKHYEYALELLDDLLGKVHDPRAFRIRAKVLAKLNSHKAAIDDLKQLENLYPTHPSLLSLKAKYYLKLNNKRKAQKAINQALEYDPYRLAFYKIQGRILAARGKTTESIQKYQQYLSYRSNDTEALFQVGRALFKEEQYLEALKKFNQVLKNEQTKAAYFKARGKTYMNTETYKRAEADFSMALDINPTGELYYLRGNARFYSGNAQGACHDWKKALINGYNDAIINKEKLCK